MKYILLTAALLLPGVVTAADTSRNPDRYISLGMDWTYGELPHGSEMQTFDIAGGMNLLQTQDHALIQRSIVGDVRAPVNNWLTVSFHGGPWSQTSFSATQGYTFGGGFRVYLNGNMFDD